MQSERWYSEPPSHNLIGKYYGGVMMEACKNCKGKGFNCESCKNNNVNDKETICCARDEFAEKLAHEVAMASAIEDFKNTNVNPSKETGFIINSYYQHKRRAIYDIFHNYKIETLEVLR